MIRLSRSETSTRPPSPVRAAAQQREDDPLQRGHAGEDVGDGGADAERRPVRRAGQAHEAAFALDDGVVARTPAPGTVRTVAGDGGVDDARGAAVDLFVGEAEPVEGARPEVLDEHVRRLQEPPQDVAPRAGSLRFRVMPALAAVDGEEVDALAVHEGRSPAAGVVALGRLLDLDDVGAGVGQGLRAVGAGQDAREVDDADAVEGIVHGHGRRWYRKRRLWGWPADQERGVAKWVSAA